MRLSRHIFQLIAIFLVLISAGLIKRTVNESNSDVTDMISQQVTQKRMHQAPVHNKMVTKANQVGPFAARGTYLYL